MSIHNVMSEIDAARAKALKKLTATTTLTIAELLANDVIDIAAQATTLPAASAAVAGRTVRIINSSTAANLTCTEGFGAGTTNTDVLAIANGAFADIYCDPSGADWYYGGGAAAS